MLCSHINLSHIAAMFDGSDPDAALVEYLSVTSSLSPAAARRCVAEVLAWYSETLEAWVVRRHLELQRQGSARNEAIYRQIIDEAAQRRFAPVTLSPRQVRRIIYG